MKYNVKTRIVKAVKKPERTDFPTPITPPNVEINKVPSEVIDLSFDCKVSIKPNCSLRWLIVSFFIKSCSRAGAVLIS